MTATERSNADFQKIMAELSGLDVETLTQKCLLLIGRMGAFEKMQQMFFERYSEALDLYVLATGTKPEELLKLPAQDLVMAWLVERAKSA